MLHDILVDPGEHILTKRRSLNTLRKCINQYLPPQMKQYDSLSIMFKHIDNIYQEI